LYFVLFIRFEVFELFELFVFFDPHSREIRPITREIFSLASFPFRPRQNSNLTVRSVQHILKRLPLAKTLKMAINRLHLSMATAGQIVKRPVIVTTSHNVTIRNQTPKLLLGITSLQRLSIRIVMEMMMIRNK